jgi:hypothetical protein
MGCCNCSNLSCYRHDVGRSCDIKSRCRHEESTRGRGTHSRIPSRHALVGAAVITVTVFPVLALLLRAKSEGAKPQGAVAIAIYRAADLASAQVSRWISDIKSGRPRRRARRPGADEPLAIACRSIPMDARALLLSRLQFALAKSLNFATARM